MRQIAVAALLLALGTGCAISEIKRVNQRLKEDNDRLLMESQDLRAQAERADRLAEDQRLQAEDLRQQLAIAQRKAKEAAPPAEGESRLAAAALKDLEDVDVQEDREGIRVILSEKVFFLPGSSDINVKGRGVLDKVAGILNRDYAASRIRVDGHTDSTPIVKTKDKFASNWELSTDRACAVVRHLVSRGVKPERISAAGYAYFRPVASEATEAGKQKNRRVEIVILRS